MTPLEFKFTEKQAQKIDEWKNEHNKIHHAEAAKLDAEDRAALTGSWSYEYFFRNEPPFPLLHSGCRCTFCGDYIDFWEDDEDE